MPLRVVIPADHPPLVTRSRYLRVLQEEFATELWTDPIPAHSEEERVSRAKDADVLLNSRGSVKWPRSALERLPQLKMIAVCGIGFDMIDLPAATEQGIVVCNIPGRTATIVAEHAFALLLATCRRMAWTTAEIREGRWPDRPAQSMIGRRIGIIGTGNIGCEMIRLCKAIGMSVVAWSFHPNPDKAKSMGFEYVALDTLLSSCDAISLHVRLSPQTRGLIGQTELHQMQPGSVLVNTSRGAVVDSAALADALQKNHLAGAGLDVFDEEPPSLDHPLLRCANVVMTPHSADQTQEGIDALCLGCLENIRQFRDGTPTNVLNPEVLNRHH